MTQTVRTLKRSNQLKNCIDAHSSSQTQSILLSCEPCEPEMTAAEPRHQKHQRNQRYQRHLLGIPIRCELVNWACALCALRALSDRVSSAWKDFWMFIPIRGKLWFQRARPWVYVLTLVHNGTAKLLNLGIAWNQPISTARKNQSGTSSSCVDGLPRHASAGRLWCFAICDPLK